MIIIESLQNINVRTTNLEKSIEFYTMFLDFELISQEEETALVSFDNLTIKLKQVENIAESDLFPLFSFIMDVDDFTDALQEIEESGYEIAAGPSEIQGGENILIKDPGGNIVELYYQD